jgi:hypothetical protein
MARQMSSIFPKSIAGKGHEVFGLGLPPEVKALIEKIQEPIEVLSRFVEGKIQPLRFRWRGRVFTVSEIAGSWVAQSGEQRVHFFSVGVGTRDYYEIAYRVQTSRWSLENVYLDP